MLRHTLIAVFASALFGSAAFSARAGDAPSSQAVQAVPAEQYQPPPKHKGAKRWKEMTPEQRAKAREHYQHFRQLPPEEQARIRKRHNHFKKLSPEERKELRDQWDKMSPEERKALSKKRSERRLQHEGKTLAQPPTGSE